MATTQLLDSSRRPGRRASQTFAPTRVPGAAIEAGLRRILDEFDRDRLHSSLVASLPPPCDSATLARVRSIAAGFRRATLLTPELDGSFYPPHEPAAAPLDGKGALVLVNRSVAVALLWWPVPGQPCGAREYESAWHLDPESVGTAIETLRASKWVPLSAERALGDAALALSFTDPDPACASRFLQGFVEDIASVRAANQARLEAIGHASTWIAHTLNNALTPILLGAEISSGEANSDLTQEMLGLIIASARHGGELTSQLLAAGAANDSLTGATSLTAVAGSTAASARLKWPDGIGLVDDLPSEPLTVAASPSRTRFIVDSLLGAAASVTNAGGGVRLTAVRGDDTATLRIVCTGADRQVSGIEEALIPGPDSPFVEHEGLALVLTRMMVESLGGSVAIESTSGRTIRFEATLPLAR